MKSTTIIVVGLFLISSFTAISIGEEAGEFQETINQTFSNLVVKNSDIESYVELNFEGTSGHLYRQSEPILPIYTSKLTLPFGTEIEDIQYTLGNIKTMELSNKIIPAPNPMISGISQTSEAEYIEDEAIYNSNELFPNNWFDYYVGVGLDENMEHKTFLTTRAFPVRYSPGTNTIKYVENIELTVTYSAPGTNLFPSMVDYELVIIAPQKFESDLDKLVTHKNSKGVTTLLMTTEDIYSQYTGVDKPEQIKYFIKDAIETYNTQYVLLVGGLKSIIYGKPRDDRNQGTADWYLPARYTNLRETGATYDPGFLSDLYYADIYKEGGVFDNWDSDGDGIFAKWDNTPGRDTIDFYPDVVLGRLACRNNFEVNIMVNKIINYEKSPAGAWYDTMILAGGDSFNDSGTNYLEGEVVSERIFNDYMSEFTPVKLYASNKVTNPSKTPTGTNIGKELTKGAGHIFLDGHASPYTWTTHWPGEFTGPDSWTERFWIFGFPSLWNFGKLPVCAVEGCHNSQFNQSILAGLADKDNTAHMYVYGQPIPECWSWWLTRKIGGGSIATIGNTALGYGAVGENGDLDGDNITEPDILEAFGGFYFDQFYYQFDAGNDILGEAHTMALTSYLDARPGMDYQIDAKTMEQMTLLGDPSLKIGGYPAASGLNAVIVDAEAGLIGSPSEDVMLQAAAFNGQGEVTFSWDLDNDGEYDDAQGQTASKSWILPGVYWVSVKVTDENGEVDTYDTIVGIEIGADKPAKPSGEITIKAGEEYTYTANINTQGGYWNNIYYMFSWDDGTFTDWLETPSATHTWDEKGTYSIKVKALLTHETEDEEDMKETDWSNPLLVTLTKSKPKQMTIFEIIQYFFQNYPNAFPILRQLLGL